MHEIQLTQGYVARVSDKDFKRVSKHSWVAMVRPHTVYAARNTGKTMQYLHRFILGITNPSVPADHRDRDGLNCTRRNLRVSTPVKNSRNTRVHRDNKSGVKGVSKTTKGRKPWRARIMVSGKGIYLGEFYTLKEADKAYKKAEKEAISTILAQ